MPSSRRIQSLRLQAFQHQGGLCFYCQVRMWLTSPAELGLSAPAAGALRLRCTAEHLLAQCEGGGNTPENIVAACAHCNHTRHRRKRPPQPQAFLKEVRARVALGGWHAAWVFEQRLFAPALALPAEKDTAPSRESPLSWRAVTPAPQNASCALA